MLQYVSGAISVKCWPTPSAQANPDMRGGVAGRHRPTGYDTVPFRPTALADREVYRGAFAPVVCRLGAKLADALALATLRDVLHCDIKPSNVLLDRYGARSWLTSTWPCG